MNLCFNWASGWQHFLMIHAGHVALLALTPAVERNDLEWLVPDHGTSLVVREILGKSGILVPSSRFYFCDEDKMDGGATHYAREVIILGEFPLWAPDYPSRASLEAIRNTFALTPLELQEREETVIYLRRSRGDSRMQDGIRFVERAAEDKLIMELERAAGALARLVVFDGKLLDGDGDLSPQRISDLFSSAYAIVGPHGGAFANMVFCRPGTLVVEIADPTAWSGYWGVAHALGLRHFYVPVRLDPEGVFRRIPVSRISEAVARHISTAISNRDIYG